MTVLLDPQRFDAVLLDMDGVVTDTAAVHRRAWARLFDPILREHAARAGSAFVPFSDEDYLRHVDGRRREDGIRVFLASRGIDVVAGEPGDPPDRFTAVGLGRRKNAYFLEAVATDGVRPFPGTVRLVHALATVGIACGVFTASRNARHVLTAAGVADLFATVVDGDDAARAGLAGKPAPDVLLETARRLGAAPERAVVAEDALAGVAAGHAGGFALVLGVDRGGPSSGQRAALLSAGADLVVGDLGEVLVVTGVRR
ncbi:MAG TPA: HAD-IA family hydrolase [Motilibacteraceae bacterium]|nr:HAD-IA family hydrolase [Motilibacteraceae bacterium]